MSRCTPSSSCHRRHGRWRTWTRGFDGVSPRRIDRLAQEPRGGGAAKLRGADDVWRVRVGDYRILYRVEDERLVILVIRIAHRREAYRRRP